MTLSSTATTRSEKIRNRILVLQHVECEPPAAYEDILRTRQIDIDRIQLGNGESLPNWREYDALIVMGGPMGANDDEQFPWLRDERALIAEAVGEGLPYWGVCLGAQLLASAFGADIYRGDSPEVGMCDVTITDDAVDDPVFSRLSGTYPVFQWHSDSFTLPPGFQRLCKSTKYENQVIANGAAYGIQFHVEVTENLAIEWGQIPEYRDALESLYGEGASERIVDDLRANSAGNLKLAQTIFTAWLNTFVVETKTVR
ncbi:GMP synthase (plasmid) [Rhodococcus qingshengii]|uniref:type 1 glutamine amidotransferase n=1 Tax=Rhodococcus qingshengii TaxID=334542 RepID=UPI0007E55BFD|nr:type 1 glutamine amidotransferase [Rhodococcus qingshengii]BCF86684.1 GMP synthase [Rhodococcus qingshengii]